MRGTISAKVLLTAEEVVDLWCGDCSTVADSRLELVDEMRGVRVVVTLQIILTLPVGTRRKEICQ